MNGSVGVTGASGFVGASLCKTSSKFQPLNRLNSSTNITPAWSIPEGLSAIVHLAGDNIASGYWTKAKMQKIYDSRVIGTRNLVQAIEKLSERPKVLVAASAVGYYGNRGDKELTEESSKGEGFLADVVEAWEEEAKRAEDLGVRVVSLRFGVILDPEGGALKKMLPAFKFGLGAVLGSGKQYVSWISRNDVIRIIEFVLNDDSISGPVNCVAPVQMTNEEFTHAIAASVGRGAYFKIPAWLLRAWLGKLADETLLLSQRVLPQKLELAGFVFAQK